MQQAHRSGEGRQLSKVNPSAAQQLLRCSAESPEALVLELEARLAAAGLHHLWADGRQMRVNW